MALPFSSGSGVGENWRRRRPAVCRPAQETSARSPEPRVNCCSFVIVDDSFSRLDFPSVESCFPICRSSGARSSLFVSRTRRIRFPRNWPGRGPPAHLDACPFHTPARTLTATRTPCPRVIADPSFILQLLDSGVCTSSMTAWKRSSALKPWSATSAAHFPSDAAQSAPECQSGRALDAVAPLPAHQNIHRVSIKDCHGGLPAYKAACFSVHLKERHSLNRLAYFFGRLHLTFKMTGFRPALSRAAGYHLSSSRGAPLLIA